MPNKKIFFSIVLYVENNIDKFQLTLDSIIEQKYSYFELLIISSIKLKQIIFNIINKEYQYYFKERKIILLCDNNFKNYSEAYNFGIKYSKNDWIVYCRQGTTYDVNFLSMLYNNIVFYKNIDCFICKYSLKKNILLCDSKMNLDFYNENLIDIQSCIHSKKIYFKTNGFNPAFHNFSGCFFVTELESICNVKHIHINLIYIYNFYLHGERNVLKYNYKQRILYSKKMNYPKISVVIVSYNHEKYIAQAIESVIVQEGMFQLEIIISDDGSNDNTKKIIKLYKDIFPDIIMITGHICRKGISSNYKNALSKASGKYIAILEADDYWIDKNKLADQLDFLETKHFFSMVFSREIIYNENKQLFSKIKIQNNLKNKIDIYYYINKSHSSLITNLSSCMFKASLLKSIPKILYKYRLSEVSIGFYMLNFGYIGYIDKIQGVYRHHSDGAWSGLSLEEKIISKINIRKICVKVCPPKFKNILLSTLKQKLCKELLKYKEINHATFKIQKNS